MASPKTNKNKNFLTPGDELIFLPLGGSGEIGMNVNLYGCRGKWVMVDLGPTSALSRSAARTCSASF
jgi:mRNA degradation ribonuclease J1/J2